MVGFHFVPTHPERATRAVVPHRHEINFMAKSSSPLKGTKTLVDLVGFSRLTLLAMSFSSWRGAGTRMRNISY